LIAAAVSGSAAFATTNVTTTDAPDKYVFVGKSLWDVDAGQQVSPDGAPKTWLGGEVMKIAGVTDRVFLPGNEPPAAGMAAPGMIAPLDGSGGIGPKLDGKPLVDSMGRYSFWASADHHRVVFIQDGDYWRGEINWNAKPAPAIVNRKKVTSVGAFGPINVPLLWWGNTLIVWGDFDKAKPIVRIDLLTGTTDELPNYDHALDRDLLDRARRGAVSPDGARAFQWSSSLISSYDVRTGKASTIANKYEHVGNLGPVNFTSEFKPYWADDNTAYTMISRGDVAKLDFRNSRMDIVAKADETANHRVASILPSGRYADVIAFIPSHDSGPTFKERYLLDLTSGQHIALPFDDRNSGKWLDDSKYLYYRDKGGLGVVGVWFYNRDDNSNKRLGGGQLDLGRMCYLPTKNVVVAVSQQNGATLRKINLDGSGIQDLGSCGMDIPTRMPDRTIDLGLGGGATADLWKPVTVDMTALAPNAAPEAATGKVKLKELTKNESPENQQFADYAYGYCETNAQLNESYDPVKFAMIMLDAHKKQPSTQFAMLLMNTDYSAAVDPEALRQRAHGQAAYALLNDSKLNDNQRSKIADQTGQLVHDAYAAEPKLSVKDFDTQFQKAFKSAKAAVLGATTPTAATESPVGSSGSTAAASTESAQPVASASGAASTTVEKVEAVGAQVGAAATKAKTKAEQAAAKAKNWFESLKQKKP
jgi:hypothetical protein